MLSCLQATAITYHLFRPLTLSAQQPIWAMPTLSRQSLASLPTSSHHPPSPQIENVLCTGGNGSRTAYLCSDFLGARESGVQKKGCKIFHTRPNWSRDPSSLLYNRYLVSFLAGCWQQWHGNDNSQQSSTKVKERVELQFHASFIPTWQVIQRTLPFCRRLYHQCSHVQILPKPSLSSTTQPSLAE